MNFTAVFGALLYLRATSLRNSVVSRIKRLRQPKYLVGAVVGCLYLYFVFFRRMHSGPGRFPGPAASFAMERLPFIASLGAALLTIFVALYWLWPRDRASLAFSEAEIAFLFPAPIGRRTLLHFRTISAQLRILFTSTLIALFSSGWSFLQGNFAIRLFGVWLILATLDLHAVGSSFAITRLLDRGITSLRRQLLTFAIAAVVIAIAVGATWQSLRAPSDAEFARGFSALVDYAGAQLGTTPLSWILAPARWIVGPLLAHDARSFIMALGPALLLFAAHYAWVLRSEVSFEEASIARAQKVTARREAMQRDGNVHLGQAARKPRRNPFDIAAVVRPELAFLWKNLLATTSYVGVRTWGFIAAIVVVLSRFPSGDGFDRVRSVVAVISCIAAGALLVFGPLFTRLDLRLDLPNTDILKTYPLRGWQIVAGQILAPVAIITTLVWLLLWSASFMFHPQAFGGHTLPLAFRVCAAIALGLVAPFLCAIEVLVLNAAVVLFPGWVPTGAGRATGIDVLGQRIFFTAGLFVTTTIALLPAMVVAGVIYFVAQFFLGGAIAAGPALLAALAVLGVEIALVALWVGSRFERFDLSAELRP